MFSEREVFQSDTCKIIWRRLCLKMSCLRWSSTKGYRTNTLICRLLVNFWNTTLRTYLATFFKITKLLNNTKMKKISILSNCSTLPSLPLAVSSTTLRTTASFSLRSEKTSSKALKNHKNKISFVPSRRRKWWEKYTFSCANARTCKSKPSSSAGVTQKKAQSGIRSSARLKANF